MKRFFNYLFIFLYTVAIGEIGLRTISNFINVSDIEKLKYAKELISGSNNPNLSSEHIPNSQSKLMGVDIILNSLGHRNKEIAVQKPKNEYRIYVLEKRRNIQNKPAITMPLPMTMAKVILI